MVDVQLLPLFESQVMVDELNFTQMKVNTTNFIHEARSEISMNRFINNKVTFYEEFVDRIKCVIVDCCDSFVYFAFQWK